MYDSDQFFGSGGCVRFIGRLNNLFTDMILDNLNNKAVHGTSAGRRLPQQLSARRVLLDDRTLQCVDPNTNATEPFYELGFFRINR